jgi:Mannosyltransferase (PIG-V)
VSASSSSNNEARSRLHVLRRALARRLDREALRDVWIVFATSRGLVFAVAVAASLTLPYGPTSSDVPALTHPFGGVAGELFTPLARWDAAWYLSIAHSGYTPGPSLAFFPLYPLVVRAVAAGSADAGALLVSSYAVSLGAFAVALYLLHRLVTLELGPGHSRIVLLLLSFFPGSLYFGAPYSESLFLALAVGTFYAARTGRWPLAAAVCAAATATRAAGLALVLPLVVLWWRSERPDLGKLAWLILAPAGVVIFSLYLRLVVDVPLLQWMDAQRTWWGHSFVGPQGGVHNGADAALDGARHLISGPIAGESSGQGGFGDLVYWENVIWFVLLLLVLVAVVGVFRRLPIEYGVYSLVALLLPLSAPVGWQPLLSLPRFVAVLFPLFIWLGLVWEQRRMVRPLVAVLFVAGLVTATGLYSSWHWVA